MDETSLPQQPPTEDATTISPGHVDDQPTSPVVINQTSSVAPKRPTHNRKWLALITLVIILNLGLAGTTIWRVHNQPKTMTTAAVAQPIVKTSPVANTATPVGSQATTLHYVSKALNLEFDYPVDWRIGADASNTSLSLTSPPYQFTGADGKAAAVTTDIEIEPATATDYGLVSNDDTIQAKSESLAYTNPTSRQRKTTNLSFDGYDSTTPGTINFMFVSGVNSYSPGQTVGSKNYAAVDPHITMYVDGCYAVHCQGLDAAGFTLDQWHNNADLQPVKSIIASLRFMQ